MAGFFKGNERLIPGVKNFRNETGVDGVIICTRKRLARHLFKAKYLVIRRSIIKQF